MKIHIRILGALVKPFGKSEFDYDIDENMTLDELYKALKYNERHIPHIVANVNGEIKKPPYTLKDNDTVELFTVVGGG